MNQIGEAKRFSRPSPEEGGARKFARTVLNKQTRNRRFLMKKRQRDRRTNLQRRKGGRGWIHRIS